MSNKEKPPIINCHVHVFTGDYVPPYLAKTYLPYPIYYLLSIRWVINLIRWYFDHVKPIFYTNGFKKWKMFRFKVEMFFKRNYVFGVFKFLIEAYIVIAILYNFGKLYIDPANPNYSGFRKILRTVLLYLESLGFIVDVKNIFFSSCLFILILIFFKSVRNLFFSFFRILKVLPGKNFTHLFERYLQIGMFSKYKTQKGIYDKLKKQYPTDTHFVSLPMDMEFMEAGKIKKVYDPGKRHRISVSQNRDDSIFAIRHQMKGVLKIKERLQDKDKFHPFVFADPRRMRDKSYFDYTVNQKGHVSLTAGCLLQEYLEIHKFSGIKIYPALGYYPFEEELLPLWKYCQQKDLPIMTHCISGTIFYRGRKKKEWDTHPIFTEGKLDDTKKQELECDLKVDFDINSDYIQAADNHLILDQVKNIDFCNNFSNPLNYLCLLEEKLLKQVVNKAKDPRINSIFYNEKGVWRSGGLKKLKICFAHFGGEDQWKKFLESDRDNYTTQLILNPTQGIDFFKNSQGQESHGKMAYIWRYVDWYTIINSIILQYDNVYADLSYILHDEMILPLLKQTLKNEKIKPFVLYGTDFYVVRNHKSDKAILADIMAGLTEDEFDLIARYNPRIYLNLSLKSKD